jgi:hypothetical protein
VKRELARVSGGERVQDLRQVFERAGMNPTVRPLTFPILTAFLTLLLLEIAEARFGLLARLARALHAIRVRLPGGTRAVAWWSKTRAMRQRSPALDSEIPPSERGAKTRRDDMPVAETDAAESAESVPADCTSAFPDAGCRIAALQRELPDQCMGERVRKDKPHSRVAHSRCLHFSIGAALRLDFVKRRPII